MHIGIISSYAFIKNNNNYGALLQYYALETYLKKLGHKPYWIRTYLMKNTFLFYMRKLKNYKSLRLLRFWLYAHNGFMSFCKKQINTSEIEYSSFDEINSNPPEADAYITGSDQVWGSSALKENYLLFAPKGKKRLAYAASFGKDTIPEEMEKEISPWINTFDAVSVRETSGIDVLKKMGINSVHLLDPTFLISAIEYPSFSVPRFKKAYIYCYFLNACSKDSVFYDQIEQIAKNNNLDLHICAVQGSEKIFNNKYLTSPTPEEWLTDYRHAKYIITNTFHGTVFALIHHRQFVTVLQGGESAKQNGRMLSLLKTFHLENRICFNNKEINKVLDIPIDWGTFEKQRMQLIENTRIFLTNSL